MRRVAIIVAEDITDHVVKVLFCADPGRNREVVRSQVQAGRRHFDEAVPAVELRRLQIDSMVHAVPPGAAVILTITLNRPIPDKPRGIRHDCAAVRFARRTPLAGGGFPAIIAPLSRRLA